FPEDQAKISVFDHGLLYGDGIFEGIRFYNSRVFKLDEHIDRLFDSAKAIHLKIHISRQEMADQVVKTIAANNLKDGYVRLVVTRGAGGLGLSPYRCEKESIIVIASSISLYPDDTYENGLKMVTCATRRPTHDSLSPAVKSLNYLTNVMAKIECLAAGAEEGVMLNSNGIVAECTGDNIFFIKNGTVYTPPLSAGILYGITRQTVIDIVRDLGYTLVETDVSRYDLYTADEIFLTGTAAEVIPVREYDQRLIGEDGSPGPVTRETIAAYRKIVESTGTSIY
ncbi:MAG: branched-chain-amino-acid transaminase, partial [Verrucomicrobiota bacterium]